mgnify:CR=1 FL=1
MTTETAQESSVVITETAAVKVRTLLDQEGRDDLNLRIAVQPGGCSGLRYQLFFDDRSLDGDVRQEINGVGVVVARDVIIPGKATALVHSGDVFEIAVVCAGRPTKPSSPGNSGPCGGLSLHDGHDRLHKWLLKIPFPSVRNMRSAPLRIPTQPVWMS